MRSLNILLAVLLAGVFTSGCATIFTGSYDEVSIRSEPEGAVIYIDGLEGGRTPDTIYIKKPGLGKTEVTLRLDGYEPRTFVLRKEFNAISVINLACVVCWIVDVATGAVTNYNPQGYDIELTPEEEAYHLDDLPRDEQGRYVVPVHGEQAVVKDESLGLSLVFLK